MFERRLKIILIILFSITVVLIGRAAQLQIVDRNDWVKKAEDALHDDESIETTRGAIFDCRGVPLAMDVACIDACVDYRAIVDPPDAEWVNQTATAWVRERHGDEYRAADAAKRKRLYAESHQAVLDHINAMWETLAHVGHKSPDEMHDIRGAIQKRVESRRRAVWSHKYKAVTDAQAAQLARAPLPWWRRWFSDETPAVPQLKDVDLIDQRSPQTVLPAISTDVQNLLGMARSDLPGLFLRPGMIRTYPRGKAVCHLTGRLLRVDADDLKNDPFGDDDQRKFHANDLVGKTGLEALCEPLLRGTRGRLSRELADDDSGENRVINQQDATPGQDVNCSIDVGLQEEVLSLFEHAVVDFGDIAETRREVSVHGGAVLIDVATGQVRAMVSNPGFDPATLDDDYPKLALDLINKPLLNRATQYPLETGSTIKPVVGLGAITQGVLGVNEGIECTGYLRIGNKTYRVLRCWTASKFANDPRAAGHIAHHEIPDAAPHHGHDGNADGFLTFSDALERSCNVYFETVANRLGIEGLSYWMSQFGLGRPTGVGIEEWSGQLPSAYRGNNVEYTTWASGIGQSPVAATPIQMANVAATIARDGIWTRPTLLTANVSSTLRTILQHTSAISDAAPQPAAPPRWAAMDDRVDLHLAPAGLKAAHDGMWAVVNHPVSGTGHNLHSDDIDIAGKTGTAQAAAPPPIPQFDAAGQPILDESGKQVRTRLVPSTATYINPAAPWYLAFGEDGKNLKHSWIIGYAPADHPQVAFAVMVEYGGSGGVTAAGIAKGMLESAVQHGYLSKKSAAGRGPLAGN